MDKFEIGEIAIICNLIHSSHLNGEECEVLESLIFRGGFEATTGESLPPAYCHMVRMKDGIIIYIRPEKLRKRRPPTELSTWAEVEADMGWNPTKQSVTIRNDVAICNEGE